MLGQKCGLLTRFKKKSSDDDDDDSDAGDAGAAATPSTAPAAGTEMCLQRLLRRRLLQRLAQCVVPAAGTEVFEMRRRKRVERLKFRWIRQQLSGKARARRRSRTSSTASPLPSDDQVVQL